MDNIINKIDHTILKPDATSDHIMKLCEEAKKYRFGAVCINGYHVKKACEYLKDTNVKVASVVGFPLGAGQTSVKVFEAKECVENGAKEIDMVMNIGALKAKDYIYVQSDIKSVVDAVKGKAMVKVILETCLLTDEEIVLACKVCEKAGADFVKTSTGFNGPGANVKHVKLMKDTVGDRLRVKAAGGIRTLEQAKAMIEVGADRLGCSSSVMIAKELSM